MALAQLSPATVTTRVARMTFAYALAILFLSSADFSFDWRAVLDDSTLTTRGAGLSVGYIGVWEHVSDEQLGLKAGLHAPDFGFAGATLMAHGQGGRVALVAPWAALSVAWFLHLAWALARRRRA
jgi:hypothetical protein